MLVAGLSLGWQIAQWLLSAGRPKATLLHGLVDGSDVYDGPVTKKRAGFNLDQLRRQGIDGTPVIGVKVVNHGRASVTVDRISVHHHGGGMAYTPVGQLIGPELPYRLEAGTNASWYVPEEIAHRLAHASREALGETITGVYLTASLATGKSIETRHRFAV